MPSSNLSSTSVARPFLRWAGSKRLLVPKLLEYWAKDYDRYVEPFAGSACLFFAAAPRRALLSDINPILVKTFNAVKDHPRAVHNRLGKTPETKEHYASIRRVLQNISDPIDLAAQFLFVNRYCFNGLFRTNLKGEFNVPFSNARNGTLPTYKDLLAASHALGSAEVRCADFEEVLDVTRRGDFVYLDPPFAVSNRRIFRQYSPDSFGLDDLKRLDQALRRLDKRGVKFVLSYAHCAEALAFFGRWKLKRHYVQRNISGFSRHRRRAAELLATNLQ